MQGKIQLEQQYRGKHMRGIFEDCPGFYDLVAEYMEKPCHDRCILEFYGGCHEPVARYVEKLCSVKGWSWICSKDQVPYHNLFPFGPSLLFFYQA